MATRFTVRVLLEGADKQTRDVYTELHEQMAEAGFTKFIEAESGAKYELPQAEYNLIGEQDTESVVALAEKATAKVGLPHKILVSPCSEPRRWKNLDEANSVERILEAVYKRRA